MKTKTIAMLNNKGGVGKTTSAANLAFALGKMGRDVLVIDFDSQASLTNYVNIGIHNDEEYYGIYEMLLKELRDIPYELDPVLGEIDSSTPEGFAALCRLCICRPTFIERQYDKKQKVMVDAPVEFGFDVCPSRLQLSDFELELAADGVKGKTYRLYNLIRKITAYYHEYDYILIDCCPSIGIMTMNAITAATDGILIPTNLDLMSTRGIVNLIDRIAEVQEELYSSSKGATVHKGIIGIILNLYSERRNVDRDIQTDLERFYPFKIFKSTIPESVKAKQALFAGALFSQMYPKAEDAYMDLAKEIEDEIAEMDKTDTIIGRRVKAAE